MGHSDRICFPKVCGICQEIFRPRSGASLYCSASCRVEKRKEQSRSINYVKNKRLCNMLSSAKHRSEKFGRELDIDLEYLKNLWDKQEGKCAITGEQFRLEYSDSFKHSPNSPSLDQIEAGKGYLKGNIRFVTYQCNVALNQWGEERLKIFAEMILSGRRR